MDKLSQNRVILIAAAGLVIISFSFFGIAKNIQAENLSSIGTRFFNISASNIVFNNIVKGIFSGNTDSKVPVRESGRRKKDGFLKNFYFFLSILIIKEKAVLLMVIAFIGFVVKRKNYRELKITEAVFYARMKFYLWWALRFLTPLQMCMLNRADEYDINPAGIAGDVYLRPYLNRAYAIKSAVFFMYK